MFETFRGTFTKSRGTTLLEEFERSLPNFNSLTKERHSDFSKAVRLLYLLEITLNRLENESLLQVELTIDHLRQLHNQYTDKSPLIASAIFAVMAHIESYYLDDPDAKLVHNLTELQIYKPTPFIVASSIRPWLNRVGGPPQALL
jgi:hypothetical protein